MEDLLIERREPGTVEDAMKDKSKPFTSNTVIVIVVTTVIFVTVISIYDVIRTYITDTQLRTKESRAAATAAVKFSMVVIIIALLVGLVTYYWYYC